MKVTVETLVKAPVSTVWQAYTSPEAIKQWNTASADWHTTQSTVDLREGGAFSSRMEAKDGSFGFDFAGTYTKIVPHKLIEYAFGDRTGSVEFVEGEQGVKVRSTFDAETQNPIEQQRQGWQAILDNFAKHVESNAKKVKAIPDGMSAVTPHLICANASAAIAFYKNAFGAVEESRLPAPDGKIMHASIRIGGALVFLVDEMPQWGALGPLALKGSPVTVHLMVADVDTTFAQAVAAGAKVTMPVADMFWGDRYGQLEDPFGHRWSVATHQRDLTPEQIQQGLAQMK